MASSGRPFSNFMGRITYADDESDAERELKQAQRQNINADIEAKRQAMRAQYGNYHKGGPVVARSRDYKGRGTR